MVLKIERLLHTFSKLYKDDIDVENQKSERINKFKSGMLDLLKLISSTEYQYLIGEYFKVHDSEKGMEINKNIIFYKKGFEINNNFISKSEDIEVLDETIILDLINEGFNEEKIIDMTEKTINKRYNEILKRKKSIWKQ
jgi:hypothetical protein